MPREAREEWGAGRDPFTSANASPMIENIDLGATSVETGGVAAVAAASVPVAERAAAEKASDDDGTCNKISSPAERGERWMTTGLSGDSALRSVFPLGVSGISRTA